jgi:hypothetical protein
MPSIGRVAVAPDHGESMMAAKTKKAALARRQGGFFLFGSGD